MPSKPFQVRSRPTSRHAAGYAIAFTLMFGALVSGAAAADNSNASPAQRKACTPDVYRLCAGEIPSVPGITACLRRKKANLSEACRAVFEQ